MQPAELPYVLPPGEHLEADVVLRIPSSAEPGLYPLRAELAVTGSGADALPPSWRQVVEDVRTVTVGEPGGHLLKLVSEPQAVDVKAGETARLSMTIGTDALAGLTAEAHLISPWGTWEWMGPAAAGVEVPA
ncbi:NEW3 domain-containing protein, partial [Streptomyces doebereineriae]